MSKPSTTQNAVRTGGRPQGGRPQGAVRLEAVPNPRHQHFVREAALEEALGNRAQADLLDLQARRIAQFVQQPVCSCTEYPEPQLVAKSYRPTADPDGPDILYDCLRCGARLVLEK